MVLICEKTHPFLLTSLFFFHFTLSIFIMSMIRGFLIISMIRGFLLYYLFQESASVDYQVHAVFFFVLKKLFLYIFSIFLKEIAVRNCFFSKSDQKLLSPKVIFLPGKKCSCPLLYKNPLHAYHPHTCRHHPYPLYPYRPHPRHHLGGGNSFRKKLFFKLEMYNNFIMKSLCGLLTYVSSPGNGYTEVRKY